MSRFIDNLPPLPPQATRHFFDAPAIEGGANEVHSIGYLHWKCQNPNAKTVFCVHGLTRNARDFDFIASQLVSDFNVIAVDIAGRGTSTWLKDPFGYNYATYISDCLSLIASLKLESVHWLGTSMGGIIAMSLNSIAPHLIDKLILNDVGNVIPEDAMRRIANYAGSEHIFHSREEAEVFLSLITKGFGITNPLHWRRFKEFSIWEIKPGVFTFACDPQVLEPYRAETNDFENITEIDLAPFWQTITCPTLLLRGVESDLLSKETANAMAEKDNVELVEFAGVGHAPALMEDEQIRIVHNWLLAE